MYRLSRHLLVVACLASWLVLGELILLAWPASFVLVAVIVIGRCRNRKRKQLTTLGSARFANKKDVQDAGLLYADTGLILGRLISGEE
jgi:hypothetical protein